MEAKNEGEQKVVDEDMLPGFRFHPTDEELVGFYLKRKIQQRPLSIELIKQLDIYKYDPWDLPKFASAGEKEWYFFVPRDRKYRNSTRPNRVTGAGFWKATGTDRPIYSTEGNKCIGLKKSLVFYKGRAAKGVKTDWMMHEFRLPSLCDTIIPSNKKCIDRTIPANDSWAICRIFKKTTPVTPRTVSNSWVSPSINRSNNCHSNNSSNFTPPNVTKTSSSSSPMQENFSNISEFNDIILQSHNNFSFFDHILPTFKPIYPTITNDVENKPIFDQQFLNIPPLLDLPPSYILPQLEEPCEQSKSSIDISSMLLNVSSIQGSFSKPSDDDCHIINEFGGIILPSIINGQCHDHDLISSSMLSQSDLEHVSVGGDDHDFQFNLEDYHDFQSALMGNLNNLLHGSEDYHHLSGGTTQTVGSFPIAGFLPLVLPPETWKSSSGNMVWDCAPLS